MKNIRNITFKQDFEVDMTNIANILLGEIYNFFTENYNIENPDETIIDYNSVVTDILQFTLKYFDE